MEHCSDVYIAMTKNRYKDMLAEAISSGKELDNIFLYANKVYEDDSNMLVLKIYDIKWYNDYPEVYFLRQFVCNSEDGYSFLRIGEEFDDIERDSDSGLYEEYKWYDVFEIYRNVEVNIK